MPFFFFPIDYSHRLSYTVVREERRRDFMNYIVFDVEATCDKEKKIIMETIEIGAVKLNKSGEIIGSFETLVCPTVSNVNEFCTSLTGIKPEDVEGALFFGEAISRFQAFLGDDYLMYSWGDYDKNQFRKDCARHYVDDAFLVNHRNLKMMYEEVTGYKARGLQKALNYFKIEFVGDRHRAAPDALATAKVLQALLKLRQKHVYCKDCIRGISLFEAITYDTPIPEQCSACYPFDPEDSRTLAERKMFTPKNKRGDS